MFLKTLSIENFRGIEKLTLDLDETTVLVGENNTGKTSILEALFTAMNRAFGRRAIPFTDYDYHLTDKNQEPTHAPPVILTLLFEEKAVDEWVPSIDQAFDKAIQILDDGRKSLTFRVQSQYDKATRDFLLDWAFLDRDGNPLPSAKQLKLISDLQTLAPVFLLGTAREASQHFHEKSSFWGPFTKNPDIDDAKREAIEDQIEQINQSVLDSHKPFEIVKDRISQTGKFLPLGTKDLVSVEAVPARILDMLARTEVKIASRSGARLPIGEHGAGTQSLSVLFLFEAFLQSRLAAAYDEHSEPILALEEPESHLHPSAIRALWPTLANLRGQKLIATHSGDLLSAVPLTAIRRLARKNGKVEVFQVRAGTLNEKDTLRAGYHVRAKRGALLFARCWLLVEGETEYTLLPELARLLGHDFEQAGVSCVEYVQGGGPPPFIKLARELGIEWHLLADGDQKGAEYSNSADGLREGDPVADRITTIAEPDIEHCLWHGGYSVVYENAVDAVRRNAMVVAPAGTPEYIKQVIEAAKRSRPDIVYLVIAEASKTTPPVIPKQIELAIATAIRLAGRST